MIFVNTRRGAEAQSDVVAELSEIHLSDAEKESLEDVANQILEALPSKTRQCERLANALRRGSAFHHAGLVNEQRIIVEDAFKSGLVKVLSSTVTLVADIINLFVVKVISASE